MSKKITNLPPNILRKIGTQMTARNITSLASTSKGMRNIFKTIKVKPVLFSGTAKTYEDNPIDYMFGKIYVNGLPEELNEAVLKTSKFKPLVSLTREYGLKKKQSGEINPGVLTLKGPSISINVFKKGVITFTGGYPDKVKSLEDFPKKIIKDILGTVDQFEINNVNIQCNVGFGINLEKITRYLAGKANLEPEIRPYVLYNRKYQYRIFATGFIQISKILSQDDINESISHIVGILYSSNSIVGKYNPNRKPRRNTKTKSQYRRSNQVAPNVRTLSTTCPPDKRPTPYSFGGVPIPGHYIGVNPQGLPCCYKIPTRLGYMRPKIIARFKELGIKIPADTKRVFGITQDNYNNRNMPVNVSGKNSEDLIFSNVPRTKKNSDELVFKIGTRQCMRWPQAKLVDIAHKMGMINITGKEKKEYICQAIRSKVIENGRMSNRKNIIKNNNVRFNARRNASHFTKEKLANKAFKEYKIRLNTSSTLKNMVSNLKQRVKEQRLRKIFNEYNLPEQLWNAVKDDFINLSPLQTRRKLYNAARNVQQIYNEAESSRTAIKRARLKNIYNSIITTNNNRRKIPLSNFNQLLNENENTIRGQIQLTKEIQNALNEESENENIPANTLKRVMSINRLRRLGLLEEI